MTPRPVKYPADRVKKLMIRVEKAPPRDVIFFAMTWAKGQVYVRIAHTDRPDIRLADLSYASPFAKRLLFILDGSGKDTERWLHSAFHLEKYWGSWFIASTYLLGFVEFLQSNQAADRPLDARLAIYNNRIVYDPNTRAVADLDKAVAILRSLDEATASPAEAPKP